MSHLPMPPALTVLARPAWLQYLEDAQPALAEWADRIRQAVSEDGPDADQARLAGKGLLIETDDATEVGYAIADIAAGLGVPLVSVDVTTVDSFLEKAETDGNPALVSLAFGPWIASADGDPDLLEARCRLAAILDDPRDRRIFVVCAKSYVELAPCLRCAGRFDAYLAWDRPTPSTSVRDFIAASAGVRIASEVTRDLDRLGRFLCMRFPGRRRLGLLGIAMRRLSHRTGRPIGMSDLMEFAANGTQIMGAARPVRDERKIAVHEAGHALAYVISSNWASVPDFVTIVPGNDYLGLMIESFSEVHRSEWQTTVREVCARIKTVLAGRAAEARIYGVENVSAFGAEEDLAEAHALATRLAANAGMSVVAGRVTLGPWTLSRNGAPGPDDVARAEQGARDLLDHCWSAVVAMMDEHQELLLRLTEALIEHKCLTASDVRAVIDDHAGEQALAA